MHLQYTHTHTHTHDLVSPELVVGPADDGVGNGIVISFVISSSYYHWSTINLNTTTNNMKVLAKLLCSPPNFVSGYC